MAKSHIQSMAAEVIARACLATRMRRLNRVISGIYDRAFRPIGVTASQVSILVVLTRSGGSKPAEVCLALQMDKSTLCRNVQRMLRQGWVRTVATDDARSHRLEATEVGRGLIERALPLWRGAQGQAREVLGDAVADQLFEAVDTPFPGDDPVGRVALGGGAGSSRPGTSLVTGRKAGVLEPSEQAARVADRPGGQGIFFWE